jgi:putative endonuclease
VRKHYYVYIMASRTKTLYTGITNNLERRVDEHRSGVYGGFTSKYRIGRLVYYEAMTNAWEALQREKQIKSWRRSKKIEMIESTNPEWDDLSATWYERNDDSSPV